MTITFKQMPTARRTPGRYTEINPVIANRGLSADPIRVLVIGQRLTAGVKAALDLVEVTGADNASSYFGAGSMLARMFEAAFDANPYLYAFGLALDDDGAGVAATQTITVTGPATGDGVISVWIAGERVDCVYSAGDAATDIAAALAAAITAALTPDLPMVGTNPTPPSPTVTLTARNKGTLGTDIDVHIEVTSGTGAGATVAAGISGATDPDLQDALDIVILEDFDFIIVGHTDATNLGDLETHLTDLVHPLKSLGAVGVYGYSDGTISNATTLAANFSTCGFLSHGYARHSPTWDPEIAARYGAVLASQSDPSLPYNNLATGILPPWASQNDPTSTEVESLLWAGVTPLVRGAGEEVRIIRAITTYTENDAGGADDAWLDVTVARTLFYIREQVNNMLATKYPRDKNTATRRAAIRQDILALLKLMEQAEIVENVEDNADGVLVEVNGSDPNRCDYVIPADIVDGLHVLAGRIDLTR